MLIPIIIVEAVSPNINDMNDLNGTDDMNDMNDTDGIVDTNSTDDTVDTNGTDVRYHILFRLVPAA